MSTGFNWFKQYRTKKTFYNPKDIEYSAEFLDGDSTGFSGGNIGIIDDLLEEYDIYIPRIRDDYDNIEDLEKALSNLIEPSTLSNIFDKILKDDKIDKVGMRKRVQWMKELSDEGYFLCYDYD